MGVDENVRVFVLRSLSFRVGCDKGNMVYGVIKVVYGVVDVLVGIIIKGFELISWKSWVE